MFLNVGNEKTGTSRISWLRSGLALAFLVNAQVPEMHAQTVSPPNVRGVANGAATRSVSRYLGLERNLEEALMRRDRPATLALLTDDFELRSATNGDAESSEVWLNREFASKQREGTVRELSVREFDDIAIVSFLIDRGQTGRPASATFFVTDVWRQSTQRLLTRSITLAAGAQKRATRPSGRE